MEEVETSTCTFPYCSLISPLPPAARHHLSPAQERKNNTALLAHASPPIAHYYYYENVIWKQPLGWWFKQQMEKKIINKNTAPYFIEEKAKRIHITAEPLSLIGKVGQVALTARGWINIRVEGKGKWDVSKDYTLETWKTPWMEYITEMNQEGYRDILHCFCKKVRRPPLRLCLCLDGETAGRIQKILGCLPHG